MERLYILCRRCLIAITTAKAINTFLLVSKLEVTGLYAAQRLVITNNT